MLFYLVRISLLCVMKMFLLEENFKPWVTPIWRHEFSTLPKNTKKENLMTSINSKFTMKHPGSPTWNSWDDEQMFVLIVWHQAQPIWRCKDPSVLVFWRAPLSRDNFGKNILTWWKSRWLFHSLSNTTTFQLGSLIEFFVLLLNVFNLFQPGAVLFG